MSVAAEPETVHVPGSDGRSIDRPLGNLPGTFFSPAGCTAARAALIFGISFEITGCASSSACFDDLRSLRIWLSASSSCFSSALYVASGSARSSSSTFASASQYSWLAVLALVSTSMSLGATSGSSFAPVSTFVQPSPCTLHDAASLSYPVTSDLSRASACACAASANRTTTTSPRIRSCYQTGREPRRLAFGAAVRARDVERVLLVL